MSLRQPRVRTLVICLSAVLLALVAGAEAARKPEKAPRKDAVAGELIVRFAATASDAEQEEALAAAGAKAKKALGKKHTKLAATDPAATERALKILAADPRVEYAEPNYRVRALAVPNDPSYTQLWGLQNTGQAVNGTTGSADADIDADEAWNVTTGSSSVTVAVIDTGVDFGHPDLGGSMSASPLMWTNPGESCAGCRTDGVDNDGNGFVDDWRGWDFVNNDNNPFDDEGHGTHVAGTIGALGNNGVGVTGVSWNVKIMALKFLDEFGGGTDDAAIEAIRYASRMGVTATNNSWGGGEHSQAMLDAITEADAAGSLFIAAAGNETNDNDAWQTYPASYEVPNVISVAATDQADRLADFSNYGVAMVDLGAPGVNVYSTLPGGRYDWYDGTSMATPHVTGVAALARAVHPTASAVGLKGLLLGAVDPRPELTGLVKSEGRLNAAGAVTCTSSPRVWVEQPAPGFRALIGNPVTVQAIGTVCGNPQGTTVTATVNGAAVVLSARGDGLYTGSFTPAAEGALTVSVTANAGGATATRSVAGAVRDNYRTADGPYSWIDATAGGTRLTLGDDDSASVALPFPFRLYELSRSSVEISSNGYLMFAGYYGTSWTNTSLPDADEPNALVAAYWDDLNPAAGGSIWYRTTGTAPNRKFVVSWIGVPSFGTTNGVTFQAILEEGTNDVVLQYQDVAHGSSSLDYGASATVGVEDDAGESAKQFLFDQALLQPYQGAKSLRFTLGMTSPPDTTPPAAPTGLTATGRELEIALDWADSTEPDFGAYRVYRRAADGSWAQLAPASGSAYVDRGLAGGSTHAYRVTAIDLAGNESAASAEISATALADTTPPAVPTGLAATAGNGQVALDWANNTDADLAGYRVELRRADGSWAAIASPTPSAYTHSGLTNGTAYTYRVLALDRVGNASAPTASVTATPVAIATYSPGSYTVANGTRTSGSLSSLAANDSSRLTVDARTVSSTLYRAELRGTLTIPAGQLATLRSLTVTYDGHVSSSSAALRVRVLNRRTGAWVTVDGPRTGVTSDRLVSWTAPVPADFVSASGDVLVGAYAERSTDFRLRSDLISITVGY